MLLDFSPDYTPSTRTFSLTIKMTQLNHQFSSTIQSKQSQTNMSKFSFSTSGDVDFGSLLNHFLDVPDAIGKVIFPSSHSNRGESKGSIPVDIVDSPKEFVLYMDVPGLSKSDIQVMVEEENLLVVKSNGKRKRDENDEEGCKYLRLERRPPKNLVRKFRMPENCNMSAITAKCENGVLTVVVEKLPPPPKSKTVQVAIS